MFNYFMFDETCNMKNSIEKTRDHFENIRYFGLVDGFRMNVEDNMKQWKDRGSWNQDGMKRNYDKWKENFFNELESKPEESKARKLLPGDVIAVKRLGGIYEHFAIYSGNGNVIHFAAANGDFGKSYVHEAPFSEFLRYDKTFEVLNFTEKRGVPTRSKGVMMSGALCLNPAMDFWTLSTEIFKDMNYHLYSNQETLERARRIARCVKEGKKSMEFDGKHYSLIGNNCENFAIWCKTGISESRQVKTVIHNVVTAISCL